MKETQLTKGMALYKEMPFLKPESAEVPSKVFVGAKWPNESLMIGI